MSNPLYPITTALATALSASNGECDTPLGEMIDQYGADRVDTQIAVCQARLNAIGDRDAIDGEIARLNAAKAMVCVQIDRYEEWLRQDLERLNETKFPHPLFGFTLKTNPPSVLIDDGAMLPEEYTRSKTVTVTTPDRTALLALAKAGGELPAGVSVVRRKRLEFAGE